MNATYSLYAAAIQQQWDKYAYLVPQNLFPVKDLKYIYFLSFELDKKSNTIGVTYLLRVGSTGSDR